MKDEHDYKAAIKHKPKAGDSADQVLIWAEDYEAEIQNALRLAERLQSGEVLGAIEVCNEWFAHLERQKQDSITLQKAAALARKGDTVGARRLKSNVDNQPKVYDGARLEPAVKTILKAMTAQMMKEIDDE